MVAYQIVGIVLGSLIGYAAIAGVVYATFSRYRWFEHRHGSLCYSSCNAEDASIYNRWFASAIWWFFLIPLFIGWLVLVAKAVAGFAMKKKSDFPTAKVVEKD